MTDRKYSEDEVTAIFRAATEHSESRALTGERSGGLTLADLHAIAREVGIPSDAVTRAAQSLANGTPATAQSFLGIPVSVARTVNLNRNLTDAEWELLVVRLRQVFRARGTIRVKYVLDAQVKFHSETRRQRKHTLVRYPMLDN